MKIKVLDIKKKNKLISQKKKLKKTWDENLIKTLISKMSSCAQARNAKPE